MLFVTCGNIGSGKTTFIESISSIIYEEINIAKILNKTNIDIINDNRFPYLKKIITKQPDINIDDIKITILKEDLDLLKPYFDNLHNDPSFDNVLILEEQISNESKKIKTKILEKEDSEVIFIERMCTEHIYIFLKNTIQSEKNINKAQLEKIHKIIINYLQNYYDEYIDYIYFMPFYGTFKLMERISKRNQPNDNNITKDYLNDLNKLYMELYYNANSKYKLNNKLSDEDEYEYNKVYEILKQNETPGTSLNTDDSFINIPHIDSTVMLLLEVIVNKIFKNKPITFIKVKNTKLISYVGNIGSGKSTNLALISENNKNPNKKILLIKENVEEWKPFFEALGANNTIENYKNLQEVISKSFLENDKLISKNLGLYDEIIIERITLESVMVFIKYYIDTTENLPNDLFNVIIERYLSCKCFLNSDEIYILKTYNNPQELFNRIKARGQINDNFITLDYLMSLEYYYNYFYELMTNKNIIYPSNIKLQNDKQNEMCANTINYIKKNSVVYIKFK